MPPVTAGHEETGPESAPVTQLATMADGLATADVIDALTKTFPHRSHIIGLTGPANNKTIIGPAATILFMPVRQDLMDPNRHSLGPAIYRSVVDMDPSGAVLVMASNGHPNTSLGGSTKLSRVRNLGMAGVVCDGLLRDFDELAEYPFSSYCTGEAVRAGGNEIQPYLANTPVNIGGVTVVPGDIIFADETGVAVIPAGHETEILRLAAQIKNKAANMLGMIASEDPAQIMANGSMEA